MRLFAFSAVLAVASALQSLPPVKWETSHHAKGFSVSSAPKTIYIDRKFSKHKDESGLTLIPPSAYEFAETFQQDINQITGESWKLKRVDRIPRHGKGIFLGEFKGSTHDMTYENGDPTEEGYQIEISEDRVFIGGTGARGMWWGTRTLLQHIIITGDDELSAGHVTDAPAYSTRGYLLDCGRKWYSPEFLKDLCTFASFFKMSEFQYHLMDNYPLNRGRNDTWQDVYHQFALMPEKDTELEGLIRMKNETLSRSDFEDLQQHCASRGVTVIPEIEAPGHGLAITKWKPELALEKKDLLNLSHPDTTPLVQQIWSEFLPWFQTKEVHVGADEYDSELADDYITFVNEMKDFVKKTSGKDVRIWGTHEPSDNLTVSKDIIIQHWQYDQSDPVEQEPAGYRIVNSEDWIMYTGMKNDHMPILPARYSQWFDVPRIFNFANEAGWQWDPTMVDPYNITEQLEVGAKGNKGAIMASWNDNGVDASTQLEAFYTMRNGFPTVGSRSWSGARGELLDEDTIYESMHLLNNRAPGQNLDRKLPGELSKKAVSDPLLHWKRRKDDSKGKPIDLGYGSKGMNYSLTLEVTGPFVLSSKDSVLSLSDDGDLVFSTDNWPYPLRHVGEEDGFDSGHPGRIWTNVTTSTHKPVTIPLKSTIEIKTGFLTGSRVWVNDKFVGRFEVFIFGGKNTLFSWSQMALAAPLNELKGGVKSITVKSENPDVPSDDEDDEDDNPR